MRKRVKSWVALWMSILLLLGMTACGDTSSGTSSVSSKTESDSISSVDSSPQSTNSSQITDSSNEETTSNDSTASTTSKRSLTWGNTSSASDDSKTENKGIIYTGPKNPFGNFKAVLRFTVGSDLYYTADAADSEDVLNRFEKTITSGYSVYALDKTYKKNDAVVMTGDIIDRGVKKNYDGIKIALSKNLKANTKYLSIMGEHEFATESTYSPASDTYQQSIDIYTSYFGEEKWSKKINGCYFIGVSSLNNRISMENIQWLDNELAKAAKADSSGQQPIFVFIHYAPVDTVMGTKADSYSKGYEPIVGAVLEKYPQVIGFAGHTKINLSDPCSMWQNEYTLFNCGSLNSTDGAAAYYVVEVDKYGNSAVRGYDVVNDCYIGETYCIQSCTKDYKYNERFNEEKIFFDKNAKITVDKKETARITVSFDVCSAESFVARNYIVELCDKNGNILTSQVITHRYWDVNPDKTVTATLNSARMNQAAYVKVYGTTPLYTGLINAEKCVISEPLTIKLDTN